MSEIICPNCEQYYTFLHYYPDSKKLWVEHKPCNYRNTFQPEEIDIKVLKNHHYYKKFFEED